MSVDGSDSEEAVEWSILRDIYTNRLTDCRIYQNQLFYINWQRKSTPSPPLLQHQILYIYCLFRYHGTSWYRPFCGCVPSQRRNRPVPYHGTIWYVTTVVLFANAEVTKDPSEFSPLESSHATKTCSNFEEAFYGVIRSLRRQREQYGQAEGGRWSQLLTMMYVVEDSESNPVTHGVIFDEIAISSSG
jgi:hypothetical protein